MPNKYQKYIKEGADLFKKSGGIKTSIAQDLIDKYKLKNITKQNLGTYISRYICAINNEESGLIKECEDNGIEIENVKHFWHKSKRFSLFVKNDIPKYEEIKDNIIQEMREYAPIYPKIKRNAITDGHLLVIDPADVHIGKLCDSFEVGEDYNSQIAVIRVKEGVQGILDKIQGWNIDKILFIIGNDILHIDTPKRTTTSGTPQDTEGMWYSNFLIAKRLYIDILEILITIAPVEVQYDPSNHDYTNGFFLADTLSSWFSKCSDINFNVSISHIKYFTYGENLIGSTHGDGAKTSDLPMLMAHTVPNDWANCKHRYIYTHHLHHKVSKDYMSVCIETLRSPSGTDSWHARNGYMFSPKAIEGFIHHKKHGQIARITHLF